MKNSYKMIALLLYIAPLAAYSANAETPIPRSMAGDKGKYYLLEKQRKGNTVTVIHKRVGVSEVGYTKTEVNCSTMMVRDLGYSEESPTSIRGNPSKWFDLVAGSSKSDVAIFACKKP